MKLNRKTIALLVAILCILAVVQAIPATFAGDSEYKENLSQARQYYEEGLYLLSIESYQKALAREESLPVELELTDAYFRAVENGEITHTYNITTYLNGLVEKYHNNHEIYDAILRFDIDQEDYQAAADILEAADKSRVTSDIITEAKQTLKTKYKSLYSVITDVKRSAQGTFVVKDADKYYIYDEDFKMLFDSGYDYVSVYINGYALAKKNGKTFLIDSKGVRQAYFDDDITSSTGFGSELFACKKSSKFSYYDMKGNEVFGSYDFAGRFKEGVAAVKTDKSWQVIDTEGKPVSEESFEDIKLGGSDECCSGGVIFAKKSGKYYMYDSSMNKICEDAFDDCDLFMDKNWLAAVKIDKKWGFVDVTGKTVIEAKYDTAKSFSYGLAAVTSGKECFFIDKNDEKIITGEFKEGSYFNKNGLCLIKSETFWQPIVRYYVEKDAK